MPDAVPYEPGVTAVSSKLIVGLTFSPVVTVEVNPVPPVTVAT